jgi:hypothetical protein
MNARSVLEKATAQGVVLFVADGKIRGLGPKPCAAFLSELRQHEAELIALLGGPEPTAKLPFGGFGDEKSQNPNTPLPSKASNGTFEGFEAFEGNPRGHIPANEPAHHAAGLAALDAQRPAAAPQSAQLIAPSLWFERVARPTEREPGFEHPCAARRGRVEERDRTLGKRNNTISRSSSY